MKQRKYYPDAKYNETLLKEVKNLFFILRKIAATKKSSRLNKASIVFSTE